MYRVKTLDDYVRTQDRKGNGAVLPFISLITMSALLILKRSNSNVKHLVWPDACSAGHLTPGLPELPVAPDPQQQPGWTESSQTALTCGSRVTNNFLCWDISCCNYSWGEQHGQEGHAASCSTAWGTPALCSPPASPLHPLLAPDQPHSSAFPLK